jgi:4-diphosphocytidyl-2-C-methyl-D-erythritol kinase
MQTRGGEALPGRATLARFAPAKVNLFLEVLGRRPDGYHEIVTVMESVGCGDLVEAAPSEELIVETDRADVPCGSGNVAWTIVRAAEQALGRPLPARIRIRKLLPPGSGLGAGSSDAVAALLLVLELHGVRVPRARLLAIAAAAGSDTAFFVDGGLALCTGRGESVAPLRQIGARHLVLVLPAVVCATATVYGALTLDGDRREPAAVLEALGRGSALAGSADSGALFNRLEAPAERAFPELGERRARLHRIAGRGPHLSGSGGTHFFPCASRGEARDLAALLRSADPSLDVREAASYRGFRTDPG